MQRFMTAIGVCGAILSGAHAIAAPPASQSALVKRQIISCMARHMETDKMVSYNQAMRFCKDRYQPAKEALASIAASGGSGTKSQ
jgi:hypothetical protein